MLASASRTVALLFHARFCLPNSRAPLSRSLLPPKQSRSSFTLASASQTVALSFTLSSASQTVTLLFHGHFCLTNSRAPLSRSAAQQERCRSCCDVAHSISGPTGADLLRQSSACAKGPFGQVSRTMIRMLRIFQHNSVGAKGPFGQVSRTMIRMLRIFQHNSVGAKGPFGQVSRTMIRMLRIFQHNSVGAKGPFGQVSRTMIRMWLHPVPLLLSFYPIVLRYIPTLRHTLPSI